MGAFWDGSEGDFDPDKMHQWMGPGQADQMVRQALHFCWMALPKDRKNLEEHERQFRRIVDRALRDWREDYEAFGQDDSP